MSEYILSTTLSLLTGARYRFERATIRRRFKSEKTGFCVALQAFAHHLTVSLDCGIWNRLEGWSLQTKSVLPKFFGKELNRLFTSQGYVKHPIDSTPERSNAQSLAQSVRRILQVCLAFKKFEADPTDDMKNSAYDGFIKIQDQLAERRLNGFYDSLIDHPVTLHARNFINGLVHDLDCTTGAFGPGENLQGVNPQILREHVIYPSAFLNDDCSNLDTSVLRLATEINSQQFRIAFLDQILEEGYLCGDIDIPPNFLHKGLMTPKLRPDYCSYESKRSAKMIAVPKTSRKARLIGKMHTDYVYLQSCIATGIRNAMGSDPFYSNIFPMLDQRVPSERAINSSRNGQWDTVDLSAASDWVSVDLVKMLFPEHLFDLLKDLRAERVTIKRPDGSVTTQECFSYGQMGDGTTFIVLSMVCAAISYGAIVTCRNFNRRNYDGFPIVDYGDDIQIPHEFSDVVIDCLEQFGLVVNHEKSYIHSPGYFRESCDGWGAFGFPVKPVWIKDIPSFTKFETVASSLASARLLDQRGYKKTAEAIYGQIEAVLGIKLPEAHSTDPFFGRFRRTRHTYAYIEHSKLKKVPVWRVQNSSYSTSVLGDFFNAVRAPNDHDYWRDKKAGIRNLVGFKMQSCKKLGIVEAKSTYVHPLLDL